jgi:hypothetical protein
MYIRNMRKINVLILLTSLLIAGCNQDEAEAENALRDIKIVATTSLPISTIEGGFDGYDQLLLTANNNTDQINALTTSHIGMNQVEVSFQKKQGEEIYYICQYENDNDGCSDITIKIYVDGALKSTATKSMGYANYTTFDMCSGGLSWNSTYIIP